MKHQPSIKSAAALAEFAATAAQTIAQGKTPSDYDMAMIQKHAAAVCGCDPSDYYAEAIAEYDAEDERAARREADDWQRDRMLSYRSMVGVQ